MTSVSMPAIWNSADDRIVQGTGSSPIALDSSHVMAAAEHPLAVRAALDVLAEGGVAVDAAIAAAFVLGVADPGASGVGGGGYLLHRAAGGRVRAVDFAMRAPLAAHEDCFEVLPYASTSRFGWNAVVGNANVAGPRAVAVPGMVPGLAMAHREFGRLPWPRLLEPAIAHAAEGVEVSWTTSLRILSKASELRRWPASAHTFMPNDVPLTPTATYTHGDTLRQPELAMTLRTLREEGPEALASGSVARRIGDWLGAHGSLITPQDLAQFRPIVSDTLVTKYGSAAVHGVAAPGGGITAQQLLGVLAALTAEPNRGVTLLQHVEAARLCFAARRTAGAHGLADRASLEAFVSDERLRELADQVGSGVGHAEPNDTADSTTHLAVADAEGNIVSLTLTLADNFGSAVTVPGTGVVMNNAMQWHDPVRARPSSVAPKSAGLNNMAPLIVLSPGGIHAVGAAGGIRIIEAVVQITQRLLAGDHPQSAIDAPRIDASGDSVLLDPRIGSDAVSVLERAGYQYKIQPPALHTHHYARPVVVSLSSQVPRLRAGVDSARLAAAAGW